MVVNGIFPSSSGESSNPVVCKFSGYIRWQQNIKVVEL